MVLYEITLPSELLSLVAIACVNVLPIFPARHNKACLA
jgi:hypothetical protein